MTEPVDPWVEAGGAWEPLSTLLARVEREFGVAQVEAAARLRPALEGYAVRAEVLGWSFMSGLESRLVAGALNGGLTPSDSGWHELDWTSGTLAGHQIRVLWSHVEATFANLGHRSGARAASAPSARTPTHRERRTEALNYFRQIVEANPKGPPPEWRVEPAVGHLSRFFSLADSDARSVRNEVLAGQSDAIKQAWTKSGRPSSA